MRIRKLSTARHPSNYPSKKDGNYLSTLEYIRQFDQNCHLKSVSYSFGEKKWT